MSLVKHRKAIALFGFLLLSVVGWPATSHEERRSGWEVHPHDNPDFVICDLPPHEIEERLGIPFEEMLERQARTEVRARADTIKALVLLCQWEDDPADTVNHTPAAYDTVLFSEGVMDPGSLREYFLEVSYGSCYIYGDVVGWFTQPTFIPDLYFTDFFAAADPLVDYSEYDRDGDGFVDALYVFHAGPGQEETHDPDDIWSFAVIYGLHFPTEDGVVIDAFTCDPEEHMDGSILTIRTPAHEAAHILGLPDLYDYNAKLDTTTYYTPGDVNDHPLVDWCLMGYGGYNIMSYGTRQDPSHLCAWSKAELGFLTPIELTESQHDIQLPEVENNPMAYKIAHPSPDSREYFLIENRNSNSSSKFDHLDSDFSAYFPWFEPGQNPKDPGMIIYHVDDALHYNFYGPNNPHYMVIVEDAGYDPDHPWDGYSEYSEWWYPYEFRIGAAYAGEDSGQTSFTPLTYPSTDWYDGPSGVWFTNVSVSDSVMTFDLGFGNAWPAIVAHQPGALDTTLSEGEELIFSVAVVDEDGDETTYDWYENWILMQSSVDSFYTFTAGPAGTIDTLMVAATDGELADSLTWLIRSAPSMVLSGTLVGDHLTLTWAAVEGTAEYWVYGAANMPYFVPGASPEYQYRLAILPASQTTWQSSNGVGDETENWAYLVIAVDASESVLASSIRFGEFDFDADIPQP
jgi:immune inhibitor A